SEGRCPVAATQPVVVRRADARRRRQGFPGDGTALAAVGIGGESQDAAGGAREQPLQRLDEGRHVAAVTCDAWRPVGRSPTTPRTGPTARQSSAPSGRNRLDSPAPAARAYGNRLTDIGTKDESEHVPGSRTGRAVGLRLVRVAQRQRQRQLGGRPERLPRVGTVAVPEDDRAGTRDRPRGDRRDGGRAATPAGG